MLQADGRTLVREVLAHIASGGYGYTLAPGTYGRDAIDEFWFDRKLGFCEHFAAAFVVVMRALDVPARIVTGYQGSDPRPQGDYWIVRQSNAHAWAEYWQAGEGWVRVDPTAAVAPDRVQRGASLQPAPGLVAGAMRNLNPELAARLRAHWEQLNNRWNQHVLNWSRQQQLGLLERLGVPSPTWQDLATTLIGLLCAAALAGAAWAWWDRHRQDPWQRLQRRVQARLARLGVVVRPHDTPRVRAAALRAAYGSEAEAAARALEALERLRYDSALAPGWTHYLTWWRSFTAALPRHAARPDLPASAARTTAG
jgi:transglutaminase-like putative cysteine protease